MSNLLMYGVGVDPKSRALQRRLVARVRYKQVVETPIIEPGSAYVHVPVSEIDQESISLEPLPLGCLGFLQTA